MAGQSLPTSGSQDGAQQLLPGKTACKSQSQTQGLAPLYHDGGPLLAKSAPAALQLHLSDRGARAHFRGTWHSYSPGDGLRVFKSSYAILPTNCGKLTIQKIPPLHGDEHLK